MADIEKQEGGETPYLEEGAATAQQAEVVPDAKVTALIQKEREARKMAERAVRELSAKVSDLEQLSKARESGVTSDRLAEIRAMAEAKFAADLAERDRLRQEVRSLKLDGTVKGVLAKADAVDPDVAWKLFRDEFDLTEDGQPIVATDPTVDIETYVTKTLRQKHPYLFRGTMAGGGGALGGRGTVATRAIPAGDVGAFLANLDDIASGKVDIR